MKAIVQHTYGSPDVLKLEEVEKPIPKDDEVLIKVHAASVNAADRHHLRADPFFSRLMFGLLKPKNKIIGGDFAGRVEAVGGNVKEFEPGDEVFGDVFDYGQGGFAEYVCAGENLLVSKPTGITFEEAAAVPLAGVTAAFALREIGRVQPGQTVLINGASGGVGAFAVQIAKSLGADVTAVCSTGKLDMVRSIGADRAIDYTKEDFTKNGRNYDIILAANGYHSIFDYKRSLSAGGIYVATGGSMAQIFQAMLLGPLLSMKGNKKMCGMTSKANKKELSFLKELLEAGKMKPVIDRCYPLSEAAEAFRYFEEGHVRGKVVITVEPKKEI